MRFSENRWKNILRFGTVGCAETYTPVEIERVRSPKQEVSVKR